MLTSREVIEKTGVSRATLNNYIARGLIQGPEVRNPDSPNDPARRLGYFPEDVLQRLAEIAALKGQGVRMAEIAERLSPLAGGPPPPNPAQDNEPAAAIGGADNGRGLQLTI
jgi:adenylate cyclase